MENRNILKTSVHQTKTAQLYSGGGGRVYMCIHVCVCVCVVYFVCLRVFFIGWGLGGWDLQKCLAQCSVTEMTVTAWS